MRGMVLGLAGPLLWSGGAGAEVLFSPPLVAEGNRVLDCYLANVGNVTRQVKIQVITAQGEVVKTVNATLDPGEENKTDELFTELGGAGEHGAHRACRQGGLTKV